MNLADPTSGCCGLDPELEVWIDRREQSATVTLTGILDASTSPHVRSLLADLIAQGHRAIVLDGTALDYVDGTGRSVLGDATASGVVRVIDPVPAAR